MMSPFDRSRSKPEAPLNEDAGAPMQPAALPFSGLEAVARGTQGRCPRCKKAKLFRSFLKPMARCPACGQDWTHQQADDFPAYVSIFVTGHIMAPVIIALVRDTELPVAALVAIILPLALALMIGLLQPAKGAVIALQWWFGMHGFVKERAAAIDVEAGR